MARYIKANPKVAEFLHLENDRNRVTDGNFLLWQNDVLVFGKLVDLPEILEQIGGLALLAHEAREEQDGTVVRPLPTATDLRFIVETETAEDAGEGETESEGESAPAEDTEAAQSDDNGEAEESTTEDETPAETPENDESGDDENGDNDETPNEQ